ncbi:MULTISPECIES: N-acetylmuramoyl-L-alanine amidase [Streptomyces]|uniref:N-acetylmuramoyl-L-alanine amidase n=1 Tax=Streptomyces lycii TaxID=2654337 RepID=A0ABQ7FMB7_9ACTN|nr:MULTISPECIES: N-acetylmuramoyl-L-alanine amidase [Streptomyces]KAF4408383.1 N-acetylmuramoyl-L-alanine amidase [Streptomyces lycii]PGH52672.1 N-acetylmuramoyl-L-alanine amidase [Streptomyces sp. Ru87]
MVAQQTRPAGPGQRGQRPGGGVSRRALLLGGGAVGLGVAGYLGWENAPDRLRYRVPGVDRPREEGAVDHPGAEWIPASEENWRRADRPYDYGIDRVVVHVPQATYAITLKVFRDPGHGAASHYVVRSEDGHVAQMIRELDVAYHAGNRGFNERSVGIEHEGWVDRPGYLTDTMYEASARLVAGICARYDIPRDREHIVGHVEVPGTDHTDPGPHWDWDRYMRMLRDAKAPEPSPSEPGGTGRERPAR